MKKLKITLGGKEFLADVLYDKAPKIIAALETAGKFDSVVFAANICSNEITWNTPVDDVDELENPVFYEDPGNIIYYPSWGAICVFFGPTEPAGWCNLFAKFPADELEKFKVEANKVWYKQGGLVTTEFVEVEA